MLEQHLQLHFMFMLKEQGEFEVAFAIAAILMILALLVNLAAKFTGLYFKKKVE